MRNVTLALDDDVALWTRVEAAKHDTSVSRFVAQRLRAEMERSQASGAARAAFLSRDRCPLRAVDESLPSRGALHQR